MAAPAQQSHAVQFRNDWFSYEDNRLSNPDVAEVVLAILIFSLHLNLIAQSAWLRLQQQLHSPDVDPSVSNGLSDDLDVLWLDDWHRNLDTR